jgi:signal peptidase
MHKTQIYYKQTTGISDIRLRDVKVLQILKRSIEIALRTILITAFILTTVTVVTSNTELLLGIRSYTVLSGSMEPSIPTGSIIYTMKNLGYNLHDVITFKTAGDQTVTHRVVSIENNGEVLYVTKGDANSSLDGQKVTTDKILGKTYVAIPFIGKLSEILKTPKGLLTAVFLPAVFIILFELWNIKKEIEKSVERRLLQKLKKQGGAHTHSLWPEHTSSLS